MNIGFIGLGIMGAPMAGHLLAAGHSLRASVNRSAIPAQLASAGLLELKSPAAVAHDSEVVITMLPDTPDVERVLFGENGVIEGMSPGKVLIDMSSISPIETAKFAARFLERGCEYLDAPVSGGEVGAKLANLTIMAGGAAATFERVLPLLQKMGKNITLVGEENGAGQICKIANQIIVALNIEAVSEALVFASKGGCDPERVRQALMGGFASSRILEVHGERMIKRTFDPGFRVRLHQKDLRLALDVADKIGVALPNTKTCQDLFSDCAAQEGSELDHSSLVKAIERLAGHHLG